MVGNVYFYPFFLIYIVANLTPFLGLGNNRVGLEIY